MNAYQYSRLASEFGVIAGPTLQAAVESEAYSPEQIAAMCSTSPPHFANRFAYWDSVEAPSAPPVVTITYIGA